MTQEDKNLLLQDLCARLPYEVKVEYRGESITLDYALFAKEYSLAFGQYPMKFNLDELDTIKPYLRPMSSMTEEEKSWYESLRNALTYQENGEYDLDDFNELNDFLNRRKLDRYGLIEKGLAIEAPEVMYK